MAKNITKVVIEYDNEDKSTFEGNPVDAEDLKEVRRVVNRHIPKKDGEE